MVFALDYVNIISNLLMVKIYTNSNTQKRLKDEGGQRKTLDKKQMRICG